MKHRWWQQGLPRSRWTWREDTRACGHLQMKRGNLRNLGSVGECGVQEYTFPPFSHPACTFLCPFLQFVPFSLSSAIPCNPSLLSSSSTHSSGIFPHFEHSPALQGRVFPPMVPAITFCLWFSVQHSQLLHQNVHQPFLFLLCLVESHWVFCTLKTNYSRLKSSRTYIFKFKSFSLSFWETHDKE